MFVTLPFNQYRNVNVFPYFACMELLQVDIQRSTVCKIFDFSSEIKRLSAFEKQERLLDETRKTLSNTDTSVTFVER
jgi:hypothetical protein